MCFEFQYSIFTQMRVRQMQNKYKRRAFTLIELLTVIAIIAMLTAVLSVAQRKVKIVSKNLRQKAAFHGGVGSGLV